MDRYPSTHCKLAIAEHALGMVIGVAAGIVAAVNSIPLAATSAFAQVALIPFPSSLQIPWVLCC